MEFRNSRHWRLAVTTVLLAVLAGCGGKAPSAVGKGSAAAEGAVSRPELERAMGLAADYMVRNCDTNGRFLYQTGVQPDAQAVGLYNILRHAAAIHVLCMYEGRSPKAATRQAVGRAARFLRVKAMAPVEEKPELLAVWSLPEFGETKDPRRQAKLGGAGLALVALLSAEKAVPGTTSLSDLRGLGRFVLYMQKEDGGFHSKYIPAAGGRNDDWTSLYYPGEAALGLLFLYEKDRNPEWLHGAAKAMGYLARIRQGQTKIEADHWALLCTARLLPHLEHCPAPAPAREDLVRHAAQVCESILAEARRFSPDALEHGCLTDQGRTCPTATRLEGMLSALTFMPAEYADLRGRMTAATHDGVRFLIRAQVRSGGLAGGVPRTIRPVSAVGQKPEEEDGDEEKGTAPIRIDYVQHTLSALIQYEEMFAPSPGGNRASLPP